MTIAVTYTFSNGSTASATEVNTNFQDLVDALTDGTEPVSIGSLTVAGAVALNGNTTIGNASADDLTINASLASNIVIKTANTYGVGAAGTGWTGIYFQSSASNTTRLIFASGVANITWTMPGTAGTNGYGLTSNGSGTFAFVPLQRDINTVTDNNYTVLDTDGYELILFSTGNTTRTCTLPTAADNTDRVLTIKKIDSGTGFVTLDGEGSETIDDVVTYSIFGEDESVTVKCDGSNWHIIRYTPSRWTAYTPTGGWSANVAYAGYWRKTLKQVEYDIKVGTTGAPTAAELSVNLPSNHTIDTAVFAGSSPDNSKIMRGNLIILDSGTGRFAGVVVYNSTTTVMMMTTTGTSAAMTQVSNTQPMTWANGDTITAYFTVPIVTT